MSTEQNKTGRKKSANRRPSSNLNRSSSNLNRSSSNLNKPTSNGSTNSTGTNKKKKRKKKKSLGFKILMVLLLFVLLGGTIIATYFVKTVNQMNIVELDNSNLGIADHDDLKDYEQYTKIKNIMLFGTDASELDSSGRSDSMMILTVDPIRNKIKVTSLMRDSYVRIPGFGEDKLNHAYAYGGPELAIRTINENFGLNIQEFATVDFSTLPKVIDLIGGVEINVTSEEFDDINNIIFMDNKDFDKYTPYLQAPGLQTLTGDQALCYARNRSSEGGDFARTQRQRAVIESLFKKGLETPITSYPSILNKVLPSITTNMTSSDILALGKNIVSISNGSLEQARFPLDEYADGGYIDDIWYLLYDRQTTKKQVQDYIFDDVTPVELTDNNDTLDDSNIAP